jgi:hypothetical protein
MAPNTEDIETLYFYFMVELYAAKTNKGQLNLVAIVLYFFA